MIALKKLYGNELLRIALILSLLKADQTNIRIEEQMVAASLNAANGTDWFAEEEARVFIDRTNVVHPKSLDNILIHYERLVFEELNSLGRHYFENNDRILNTNEKSVLHTYVVNNFTTDVDTQTPLAEYYGSSDAYDSVSDDANVAYEEELLSDDISDESVTLNYENSDEDLKLKHEDQPSHVELNVDDDLNVTHEEVIESSYDSSDSYQDNKFKELEKKVESVTFSESYLHNRTEDFEDLPFDISEFFISPPAMHIKTEQTDDININIKEENIDHTDKEDPYLSPKSEDFDLFAEVDKVTQSVMEISEYDQTLETLREFRVSMEYLDLKQEETDLEQFLLENQPLEIGDFSIKRERATASFSQASSSGVSEGDDESCSEDSKELVSVKRENSEELTQEDVDLIEVLWKQDVDMGFSKVGLFGFATNTEPIPKVALDTVFDSPIKKIEQNEDAKLTNGTLRANGKKDQTKEKEDDPWEGLSYVVDTETGEFILQGDLPADLVNENSESFDLIEEALKLVDLEEPAKSGDAATKREHHNDASERVGRENPDSAMLHPAATRPHPHHHHHHHAHHHPFYHHQSLMRTMSAEQRWQDLASLLAAPPPPPSADNPYQPQHYNLTASHHPTAGGYANYPPHHVPPHHMPPPPPIEKHHNPYCTAMDPDFKMESANSATHHPQHEPIYYQQPDMNGTSDGFLSSILNDEDLQLMDMAVNEGMYTMRMLDGTPVSQHPAPPPAQTLQHHAYTTGITQLNERADSGSDSAVSSMGSERVASLSDGEWCDDPPQDYPGSKFRPYESSISGQYGSTRASGLAADRTAGPSAQPPQKKHHMFGKRCFQENVPSSSESMHLERTLRPPVKYEYTEMTTSYDHQIQAQVDYASRLSQSNALVSGHPSALNPDTSVINSTIMHPMQMGSQISDRVRHNHTYSGPPNPHTQLRPHSRDKKMKRLSEGSSETGHTSRDERRAKALGIPIEVSDIINLPMDEFNERLSKHDLSEAQLSLIRDIRRRGKNKVAAQNCRKRKLDQITSLADEVRTVRERKARLTRERHAALLDRQRIKDRFAALYRHVFQHLRDAEGRPVSSAQYSLQQAADGAVVLVPKMHPDQNHMRPSDDDMDRKQGKGFEQ